MRLVDDVLENHTVKLPLAVKGNSTTELPILLSFSTGNKSTAKVAEGVPKCRVFNELKTFTVKMMHAYVHAYINAFIHNLYVL